MQRTDLKDLCLLYQYYLDPDYGEFFRRMPQNLNQEEFLQIENLCKATFYKFEQGFFVIAESDPYGMSCQIGCLLDKAYWQQKIAYLATKQFIEELFKKTQLRKVSMRFLKSRSDIEHDLQTAGFHKEAEFKESVYWNGKYVDELEYAITKPVFMEKYQCHF